MAKRKRKPVRKAATKKVAKKKSRTRTPTKRVDPIKQIFGLLEEIHMQVCIIAEDTQELKDRLPPFKIDDGKAPSDSGVSEPLPTEDVDVDPTFA